MPTAAALSDSRAIGSQGAAVLIHFQQQMVNPLAQLAILRAQRVRLPTRLQLHRIVLHLEKPFGAGQLRGRLGKCRRDDAGAFNRRGQVTEQPVHMLAGQISCRMRFAEFAVQLCVCLLKTPDPRMDIFQRRLQQGRLASLAHSAGIVRSDRPVVDGPLALRCVAYSGANASRTTWASACRISSISAGRLPALSCCAATSTRAPAGQCRCTRMALDAGLRARHRAAAGCR